ncbi:MAG: hypothetical protein AAFW75_29865, partial [Cyanobacteria bacterium J06636_16]
MATKTIHKAVKDFGNSLRTSTAGWRALPDFIVAGTQKGGTTSLYSYLAEHPRVIRATKKSGKARHPAVEVRKEFPKSLTAL